MNKHNPGRDRCRGETGTAPDFAQGCHADLRSGAFRANLRTRRVGARRSEWPGRGGAVIFMVCIFDVDKWRWRGQGDGMNEKAAETVAGQAKATRPPTLAPALDEGEGFGCGAYGWFGQPIPVRGGR